MASTLLRFFSTALVALIAVGAATSPTTARAADAFEDVGVVEVTIVQNMELSLFSNADGRWGLDEPMTPNGFNNTEPEFQIHVRYQHKDEAQMSDGVTSEVRLDAMKALAEWKSLNWGFTRAASGDHFVVLENVDGHPPHAIATSRTPESQTQFTGEWSDPADGEDYKPAALKHAREYFMITDALEPGEWKYGEPTVVSAEGRRDFDFETNWGTYRLYRKVVIRIPRQHRVPKATPPKGKSVLTYLAHDITDLPCWL